ncbi:MAG TPA: hypothetical protein VJH03_01065 [Blastocatellia bacterium]|nr:hypothetical protein [Blastocatellia bacterium]
MANQESDDNGLLQFVATTVETLRDKVETIQGQMVTKEDVASMATKDDLAHMEIRLATKMDADTTAIRGDIERVDLRTANVERTVSTRLNQIETEVSRLRSVLYLLVKDKPDILRLLGQ